MNERLGIEKNRFEDLEDYYEHMDQVLKPVLDKYYPEASQKFKPPSISKIKGHFEGSLD